MSKENPIKIYVLHCGMVTVDDAVPFKAETLHPMPYTGFFRSKKHQITIPVSAYLIEAPKGLVLVDTGWHKIVREKPDGQSKQMGWLHSRISSAILPEGEAIDEQLAAMGYRPSDLDYVVMTHLDTDHASGLQLLKGAKHFIVSREEWLAARRFNPRYVKKMWKEIPMETFEFQDTGFGPFGRSYDLFGDGTVRLVWLPGHSEGMTGVVVAEDKHYVIIAGDCGYSTKSWKEMKMPGIATDKQKLFKSLQWMHDQTSSPNCVEALANHDPDVKPHVIELSGK